MNGLEVALIILVSVWTIIFAIIALAILFVFLGIRRAINKANHILDQAEAEAEKVNLPSKAVIATIVAFMAKNSFGSIKEIISAFTKSKKKK